MSTSRAWDEPGGSWAGWADTEKVYRFDPVGGWTDTQLRQFLGIQACIWSESMMDRAVFDRLVFPRGDHLGAAKDAVQDGRRIATLRHRDLGMSVATALMSPEPRDH